MDQDINSMFVDCFRYPIEIFYGEKMSGFHPVPLVKYYFTQKKWGNEAKHPI